MKEIFQINPKDCAREKIGISYGGGAQRGVIHLGVIKAFIELGVKPSNIVGVSAGSIAAAIHAYNLANLETVALATRIIKNLKPGDFGFGFGEVALRVFSQGFGLQSLGSLKKFRKVLEENLPFSNFSETQTELGIVAANRLDGQSAWFEEGSVVDAILASSSLPIAFPPFKRGEELFVDGALTDGLPLFKLAQKGCGTIFVINLGYAGETLQPPRNLLENFLGSMEIALYQADRYETALINSLYPELKIIEIRPKVAFDLPPFSFTPEKIDPIINEAFEQSLKVIKENI